MAGGPEQSYIFWLRRFIGKRRIFHIGSIAAIRDEAGQLLVMQRADSGEWDLPGGALELGETLAQALVREVAEETGLAVKPARLVGLYTSPHDHNYTYPNGDRVQGWGALFECRGVGGSLQARDGEALALRFIPPAQLRFDLSVLNRMKTDLLAAQQEATFDPPAPVGKPTTEYYAMLRPHVGHAPLLLAGTAAFIRDDQGRVLLQRRHDNHLWGLPGGGQNLGESVTQALIREVFEETGLRVEPIRLAGVYSDPALGKTYPNGDQVQAVVASFEARITGGVLSPHSPETLDLGYFPPDALPSMQACCQIKVRDALSGQRTAFFR